MRVVARRSKGALGLRIPRLGLGVSCDAVRGVLLSGKEVVWSHEVRFDPCEGHASVPPEALDALLAAVPSPRWVRPVVIAAIGPSMSQTRRLPGLPRLDAPLLSAIVREAPSRFFLRNGVPLVTGTVDGDESVTWGVAFDESVVRCIDDACRRRGLRLTAVLPSMHVLPRSTEPSPGEMAIRWRDGASGADATYVAGRLTSLRRFEISAAEQASGATALSPGAVRPCGAGELEWRFADAFGAAESYGDSRLAFRPGEKAGARPPVSNRRLMVAGVLCALGLIVAITASGLAAKAASTRALARIAHLSPDQRQALLDERELRASADTLRQLSEFARSRRSMSLSLASIAQALPEETSLLSLRLDTAGGTLVASAPRGSAFLEELSQVPELVEPTIVGPITPELSVPAFGIPSPPAGPPRSTRERATVRFRWSVR